MIRAIVKGTPEDAYSAATQRDIPIHGEVFWSSTRETVIWVENRYLPDLVKWFCEPCGEAPFPVGTLLHHTSGEVR